MHCRQCHNSSRRDSPKCFAPFDELKLNGSGVKQWKRERESESEKNLFGTYRTFIEAPRSSRKKRTQKGRESRGGEESFSLFFLPAKRQQEAEERNINDLMSFQRENEKWII